MEENIELNKIEESKDLTQPEQEIKQKEVGGDPVTPKSASTPAGKIIQFRKGTKAAYSSSSNIDTNTISVVSNADGTSTGKFSEIFLGDDMIGCGHNFTKYNSSSNPGRVGLVPAPGSGDAGKFLSVDGWSTIPASAIPTLDYVTALGTSGNYLTWTKSGTTNNLTVPYASVAGKLGTTTVGGSTTRPIYLNNGSPTEITSMSMQYFGWPVVAYTALDSISNLYHTAGCNVCAYLKPAYVDIEYTNDNGTTWVDYEATDAQKINLFTTSGGICAGKKPYGSSTNVTPDDAVRITVHAGAGFYCHSLFIMLRMYCPALCSVKIETTTYAATTTWTEHGTYSIQGNPTYLIIPFDKFIFGNNGVHDFRLTLQKTGTNYNTSSHYFGEIRIFSNNTYSSNSNLGITGHLYSFDSNKNAIFPAGILPNTSSSTDIGSTSKYWNNVYGTKFVTNNGTTSHYVKGNGDLGNISDFASSASLANYLPLAGGTMTGPITRLYSSASNSPMLKIGSNNQDIQIFKVYSSDLTYSDTGNLCGYSLVYAGTGTSANNLLRLMADNTTTAGDKKKAITINQSGQVGILADPNTTYALHVNGKVHAVTDVTSPGFKVETSDTLNGYEYIKANGSGYGGVYYGATSSIAGTPGLVPSAATADRLKYLRGDGTWASVSTSDTNVDQVGLDPSTDRYPLILKGKDNTTNENGCVKFSKLGSASPVLSASPDGKIFAAGVAIVNDSTGLVPLYSNNEYVKADGSGIGGVFLGADGGNEQDGAPGLVPGPMWKECECYLRGDGTWHDVLSDVAGMIDHKVTMTATTTNTGKYPLLFKYSTSYTSNETNYVRFSKVASSSASILSATPAGDLYSKSLTASGGSITLAANAATPTNELVIKNTATTNATPKLRFQRAETGDTYYDWTIQNNSSGSLVVSLETTSSSTMLTMTSSGSSFGGNVSAAGTLTAGTSITATNGDIICTHSGKYFKGLLYPNATASSAYIYTHANQPLTTTGNQSEDTKPVTAKNVVQYVKSAVGNYLPLAGGTMTGNISMGGSNNITNMLDGVNSSDAATVGQALVKESINDDTYFNAEGLRIFAVATPQSNTDAANKAYVDSRVSSVTISTQDISYDQLDGVKDFDIATVAIPNSSQNQQQSGSYYLNFTNKMRTGSICHVMLHTSYSGETANPAQVNYASTPVVVKIPANIRVWDATDEGAESGDMEYVWINGDKVMECDVSNTSTYNGYGKAFTIPSEGFVEISVFFVRDECTIKKGDTYQTIKVFRTIIKVDAPTSTYSPPV